jgi:hypothetical protein
MATDETGPTGHNYSFDRLPHIRAQCHRRKPQAVLALG